MNIQNGKVLGEKDKKIMTVTHNMGYHHGWPLNITLDENVILNPYINKF